MCFYAYKVQGLWELAFINWLDQNKLNFKCHKGRLPYTINNEQHSYYPDFWIEEWKSFVDVKAPYFYSAEKFAAIQESNPNVRVVILFGEDLLKLGVHL